MHDLFYNAIVLILVNIPQVWHILPIGWFFRRALFVIVGFLLLWSFTINYVGGSNALRLYEPRDVLTIAINKWQSIRNTTFAVDIDVMRQIYASFTAGWITRIDMKEYLVLFFFFWMVQARMFCFKKSATIFGNHSFIALYELAGCFLTGIVLLNQVKVRSEAVI